MSAPALRAHVTESEGVLRINMPLARSWYGVGHLVIVLLACVLTTLITVRQLGVQFEAVRAVAAAALLLGAVFAVVRLAWMIFGREVVELDEDSLSIEERLGGFTRRHREFRVSGIEDLRVETLPGLPRGSSPRWMRGTGPIVFEFAGRSYRFGAALDKPEARVIVTELKRLIEMSSAS